MATQDSKAMRGTKRVCTACAVRFYDLARDSIACPSCGVQYTASAQPAVEAGARVVPYTGKTGWRRSTKPSAPVLAEPVPEAAADPDVDGDGAKELEVVATAEVADAAPEDDIVLEQEPDDGDVSGLIDHAVEEPKDR
jgi:hypothetical protein